MDPVELLKQQVGAGARPVAESHKEDMLSSLKKGDILIYVGDKGEEVGVVIDTFRGSARVGSGQTNVTVGSHSFIEVIPGTERSSRMADYLNRN